LLLDDVCPRASTCTSRKSLNTKITFESTGIGSEAYLLRHSLRSMVPSVEQMVAALLIQIQMACG